MRISKIEKVFGYNGIGKIVEKHAKKSHNSRAKIADVVKAIHAQQKEEGVFAFFKHCTHRFSKYTTDKRLKQLAEGAFYSYKILKKANFDVARLKKQIAPIRAKSEKFEALFKKIVGKEEKPSSDVIVQEMSVVETRVEPPDAESWFASQERKISHYETVAGDIETIKTMFQNTRALADAYNKLNGLTTLEGTIHFPHKSLYGVPFDQNRLGKVSDVEVTYSDGRKEIKSRFHPGFEDFYIAGSSVKMPYATYDIMQAPLVPHDDKVDTVSDFWNTVVVLRKSPIIVTVHEPKEKIPEFGHPQRAEYWTHDRFTPPMKLKNGWELERVGVDEVVAKSNFYDEVQLIKRTFIATQQDTKEQHVITQYHYQGWPDHCGAPDHELLEKLHIAVDKEFDERKLSLDAPITVHCAAGFGRSPVFAVSHHMRREIKAHTEQGKALDDIALNFAKTVYRFNNQRPQQLSNIDQHQSALFALRRYILMQKGIAEGEIRALESTFESQVFQKAAAKLKEIANR